MKKSLRRSDSVAGVLLFLPAVVIVIVFKGVPLITGFYLSFTRPASILKNVFAGLANYSRLVNDEIVHAALINVLKSIVILPAYILVPLFVAFLLYQRVKGWQFFRATYLFSYLLSPVMVGYIFSFVLGNDGPVNSLLRTIGLGKLAIQWFGNTSSAMWMVLAVVLWTWFGLGALIYLAAMASISEDLFESATLEGATPRQVLAHVIIPHIVPTISYWGVICTAGLFLWLFPFLYALTEGGPGYATMMPEYYIYLTTTKFVDPGYASALGISLFILIAILSSFQVRMMYSREG